MTEAWRTLFVLLFGTPLGLALGGLTLLTWRNGLAPPAWASWSGILYLLALIATFGVVQTYLTSPGG